MVVPRVLVRFELVEVLGQVLVLVVVLREWVG